MTSSFSSASSSPAITLPSLELISRYDRPGPRYTSYPTALEFTDAVGPSAYASALSACGPDPMSVYVHLPFCESRCLYCACNAIINPDHRASQPYLDRLLAEVRAVADLLPHPRPIASLHLGGGTPTFFSPQQLDALMTLLGDRFGFTPDAERAIELDPRVTSPSHLSWMRAHRFNRASVGIQDLDPLVQDAVNRAQPLDLIARLFDSLRVDVGVPSINADLIYGLPHQTTDSFHRTILDILTTLRPERIALYGFAYLPSLKPHQRKLPAHALPSPPDRLSLLWLASSTLCRLGYRSVGMDHFALPQDPLCRAQDDGSLTRNFMGYTTTHAPDILAFGLSAIGHLGGAFFQNHSHLRDYLDTPHDALPTARGLLPSPDDLLRAWVIQSIMCHFSVDKAAFALRAHTPFDAYFADAAPALASLEADGLISQSPDTLHVTPTGRWLVRNVALCFDRYTHQRRALSPSHAGAPRHDATCARTI